jgi:hypothetical protein
MPAAPFDDESIPVLTERLTLPALDLDITLPAAEATAADSARIDAAPALPTALPSPAPQVAPAHAVPPPSVLGTPFESDTWLVETIPMAPAPLDLSTLDLPSFDLPPLTPARVTPPAPAPTPAPGFAASGMAIPTSLMRASSATVAPATSAPTFDHLPALATTEPMAASETPPAVAVDAPKLPSPTELRASLLEAIALNLPQDVESIVRRQLAPALDAAIDAAVAQLVPEIRRAVAQSLHELVSHAVQAELARLRETREPW